MDAVTILNRAITSLQTQYEAKRDQNKLIQQRIDALEDAKRIMSDALNKAEQLKRSVSNQKVDSWWNGTLANQTTDHIEASVSRAGGIAQGIRDGIGEIDGYIWKLRTEYDYIVGLMSGIEDSLKAKRNERQRAIQEANSSTNSGEGSW